MNKIHWHFQFIGYNEMKEGGQIIMPVQIIIINKDSEAEALFEAKDKIERKNYYLNQAWQCKSCNLQE